jgi:hypothetical protein
MLSLNKYVKIGRRGEERRGEERRGEENSYLKILASL